MTSIDGETFASGSRTVTQTGSETGSQLFLLRHGETDWNVCKRLQGRTDISLNERGRAQARRHGAELVKLLQTPSFKELNANPTFTKSDLTNYYFVSSPLKRCRETMEIVLGALELPPHSYEIDDQLIEISFGEWEGKSWADLRLEVPDLVQARFDNPWEICGPHGETYTQLKARVLNWYQGLPAQTIAVTHSGPSRVLRGHIGNYANEEILSLTSPQDQFLDIHPNRFQWI